MTTRRAAAETKDRALAQTLAKNRSDAYTSWTQAKDAIADVLMEWKAHSNNWTHSYRVGKDAELLALRHVEDAAARVLDHADAEWHQWREGRVMDAMATSARSTAWATWVAALAAGAAVLVALLGR